MTRRVKAAKRPPKTEKLVASDPRNPAPSSEAVRRSMQGNRAKDTGPELLLRKALWAAGVRGYRLHRRVEGVRPDLVFSAGKLAVFINGCFWHRCPYCRPKLPARNRRFWASKFRANQLRDGRKSLALRRAGWAIVTVWECQVKQGTRTVASKVIAALRRRTAQGLHREPIVPRIRGLAKTNSSAP